MTEGPAGFRFPTSRIRYRDRAGLKVWPDGARMAFLFYSSAEEWNWGEPEQGLAPFPLANFGERDLALSMRSAIEFGFNVGLYRIADVLRDVGIKGTFWTSGNAVEQHREVIEMLAGGDHEIGAHGYSEGWPMAAMDRSRQADSISRSIELLSSVIGHAPTSWVGPGAAADRNTVELLAEAGITCHGDFQDDELPYFLHVGEKTMVEVPYRMVGNLNDVPLISNYGAFKSVNDADRHLRESFDAAYALAESHSSVFNFGTHPHVIGRPDATATMRGFLEYVASHDDVWITTYAEMAAWWQERFGHLVREGSDLDVAELAQGGTP